MIVSLALVVLALCVGMVGPRWLSRATWPSRAPALGVLAWQALTACVFFSLTLAALSLAAPEPHATGALTEFFHACTTAIRMHYTTAGGAIVAISGVLVALGLVARLFYVMARAARASNRALERQRDLIAIVGTAHPREPDVIVVPHTTPAVYCVPGRRGGVVVTAGALSALSEEQFAQVLAHERAHLRARHHVALLVAGGVAQLWGRRLGGGAAHDHIRSLVEMHADDSADRRHRRSLATAVVVLAEGSAPLGALSAGGGAAVARVHRLATPAEPLSTKKRLGLLAAVVVTVLLPFVIAVTPAAIAAAQHFCSIFA